MTPLPVVDAPKEKCGVIGIYTPGASAAAVAFYGLFALQHRGQESAGISAGDGCRVRTEKGMGLVNQVFNPTNLESLPGEFAIGHTRYSTTGASAMANAQPIFCQSQVGEIAVAHNGNLTNTDELRREMHLEGYPLRSDADSDSLLIAHLIAYHLDQGPEAAVRAVMERCVGAYSVSVVLPNAVLAFRDPWGNRPLTAGSREGGGYIVASETCAFGPVAGRPEKELAPGEMVTLDARGMRYTQVVPPKAHAMCLFEFIYFARPDSRMYDTQLYNARERMGERLAQEHSIEADIVVPVPDSGIPAALGFARASGIPFREGMMKSRYIHRTFISPDQAMRDMGVRLKLTPLVENVAGQRVVLVDDSIVRGTTTGQIVQLLREAGAREVHVRITAPPILHPCYYGIDMATRKQLIAANLTIPELRDHIGADSLGYLSLEGAVGAVGRPITEFCHACFSGEYPIPISPNEVTTKDARHHGLGTRSAQSDLFDFP